MSEHVDAARRLYQAIAARDAHALLEAMEEEFEGRVSQGMPLGVGGRHEGRERMLHDVWLKVFAAYDTMRRSRASSRPAAPSWWRSAAMSAARARPGAPSTPRSRTCCRSAADASRRWSR